MGLTGATMPRSETSASTPLIIVDGHAAAPSTPGLGIDWDDNASEGFRAP